MKRVKETIRPKAHAVRSNVEELVRRSIRNATLRKRLKDRILHATWRALPRGGWFAEDVFLDTSGSVVLIVEKDHEPIRVAIRF